MVAVSIGPRSEAESSRFHIPSVPIVLMERRHGPGNTASPRPWGVIGINHAPLAVSCLYSVISRRKAVDAVVPLREFIDKDVWQKAM